jgi:hypothetical protein
MKTKIFKAVAIAGLVFGVLIASCQRDRTMIDSRDLPAAERVTVLAQNITLKSDVLGADFKLFNVNFDRSSIPGASSADYKIVIRVAPADTVKWIKGHEAEITSAPVSRDWTAEVLDGVEQDKLAVLDFIVYRKVTTGYDYTLWVNRERGVILIRYVAF